MEMEDFKKQFINVAYSEFGIKAIESINFEQAFAILDKMEQLRLSAIVERSEQLCSNLDKDFNCKNMCLTHCIDGNKFWK